MSTPNEVDKRTLGNQSRVYEVFQDEDKLSIVEIAERVNSLNKEERVSEQTVRRTVKSLVDRGFIRTFGRDGNAMLYGKPEAAFATGDRKLINYAGEMISVKDFFKSFAEEDSKPFQRGKVAFLNREVEINIRKTMLYVIMSTGNSGMDEAIEKMNKRLHNVMREINYILNVLDNFTNSPVWYAHYRDQISAELHEIIKEEPELIQLVRDFNRDQQDM